MQVFTSVLGLMRISLSLIVVGNSIMFHFSTLGEVLLTTLLWICVNLVTLEEMVFMTHLSIVLCSIMKVIFKVIVGGLYMLWAW